MKRTILSTFVIIALFGNFVWAIASGNSSVEEKVIRVTARKFEFTPSEIKLKKGEPIVIELVSQDRHHGFNLPDFGVRADVKPGGVSRVRFTPDKIGKFTFICDVFCGEGHEDMTGTLIVTD